MVSSVASIAQLVATIKANLASDMAGAARAKQSHKENGTSDRQKTTSLAESIRTRIERIDANDPHRGRKAFRVFLESALLVSLGEELINDPQFFQLVDTVQAQMEADIDTSRQIDEAIRHLLSCTSSIGFGRGT